MTDQRGTDADTSEVVLAIIEDAATRLRMLMPSLEVARVMTNAGVLGLMAHGGYEEVLTTVPKAVAAATGKSA